MGKECSIASCDISEIAPFLWSLYGKRLAVISPFIWNSVRWHFSLEELVYLLRNSHDAKPKELNCGETRSQHL